MVKRMSEEPSKKDSTSSTKKGLGRGLGDLLAQHDTDLPFLGAYGAASDTHEEGLPISVGQDDPHELLKAIERHLRSVLTESDISIKDDCVRISEYFTATIGVESGVDLIIRADNLPFVPSDLTSPGFIGGNLADDRSSAEVTIIQWGIESRRLLSRLCEYHTLTL